MPIYINQSVFYLKYKNYTDNNDIKPFVEYDPFIRNEYSSYSLNESIYSNDFNQYVDDIVYNITNTYNYTFKSLQTFNLFNYMRFYCINISRECVGDNWDDLYSNSRELWFNKHDSYIVIGINSYALNLTTYQSSRNNT